MISGSPEAKQPGCEARLFLFGEPCSGTKGVLSIAT